MKNRQKVQGGLCIPVIIFIIAGLATKEGRVCTAFESKYMLVKEAVGTLKLPAAFFRFAKTRGRGRDFLLRLF